ncbi:MAG: hypothetical protein AAGG02_11450 [Cyanobacteria bacterium P01_H01_bin.15]
MSKSGAQPTSLHLRSLWVMVVVVILLGLLLRGVNLGRKPLWPDEGFTRIRVSGYTAAEAEEFIFNDRIVTVEEFERFQRPAPNTSWRDTVSGLAKEEPQLAPLYFLGARWWAQWLGPSLLVQRSLGVLFSVLSFPALFWLGWELFNSRLMAALALAFYGVSPIFLPYAQSARHYSAWILWVGLASAVLLRTARNSPHGSSTVLRSQVRNWSLYTGLLILGLYTHLLTLLVMLGHGIFMLGYARWRWNRMFWGYLVASGIASGLIMPWLWIAVRNREAVQNTTVWLTRSKPLGEMVWGQLVNLAKGFVYWRFAPEWVLVLIGCVILGLSLWGLATLPQSRYARLFLCALVGASYLPFLWADLMLGGQRSLQDRYLLVGYLAIYFAIAYLLIRHIVAGHHRYLWSGLTCIMLSAGLISSSVGALSESWWGLSEFHVEIPKIVNQTKKPLIISQDIFFSQLGFLHQYRSDMNLLLLPKTASTPDFSIPDSYSDVFIFNPPPELLTRVEQQGHLPAKVYNFLDPVTKFELELYRLS